MTSSVLITRNDWDTIRPLCKVIAPAINVSGCFDNVLVEWNELTNIQCNTIDYIIDSVLSIDSHNAELQLTDVVNFNNKLVKTNQNITLLEVLWYGDVTCWETNSGYINYKGLIVLFELDYPNVRCYYNSHWIDVPMSIMEGGRL